MTTNGDPACTDLFHDGGSDGEEYEIPGGPGRWSGTGYRCPSCGFQTVTVETYEPVEKPCAKCSQLFPGMPDAPGEVCNECSASNFDAWVTAGMPGAS